MAINDRILIETNKDFQEIARLFLEQHASLEELEEKLYVTQKKQVLL